MTRLELVKRMAESATRPLADFESAGSVPQNTQALHQPVDDAPVPISHDMVQHKTDGSHAVTQEATQLATHAGAHAAAHAPTHAPSHAPAEQTTDLYVWFEDTSHRTDERGGIAGLPEALLPWPFDGTQSMRVVSRRYAEGHMHLLAAVRLRCTGKFGERIAALYTSALSVGTVAWIGTGSQYEQAWKDLYD